MHRSPHREARPSRRIGCVQVQMKANSRRDPHLWSISMLVILVLATGFAVVLASRVAWKGPTVLFDLKYLPQLFWGMIVLILLFSIYVKTQKKELTTVGALVQELIVRDNVQAFSLLDPATQL